MSGLNSNSPPLEGWQAKPDGVVILRMVPPCQRDHPALTGTPPGEGNYPALTGTPPEEENHPALPGTPPEEGNYSVLAGTFPGAPGWRKS